MRLSCPACGAELSLDTLLAHDAARRAVAAAMHISAPLADRLMKYLALFRPAQRQLRMERVADLLEELLPMIRDQKIKRGHREYSTILETWKQAIDAVLANRDAGTLKLPLKSHGYLLEVLVGMCERFEAGEEERAERLKRTSHRVLLPPGADEQAAMRLVAAASQRVIEAAPAAPRQVPEQAKQVLDALGFRRRKAGEAPAEPSAPEGEAP